ncbi:MAG: GTP-binding protein EngB [Candidatus Hadarchaeota archaeon]
MEIVVVGRSNVGKSSLIRQITGKKVEVGRRPGVTRGFDKIKLGNDFFLVDLPGFGYISGLSKGKQDEIKTEIVNYLEENKSNILFAIEVIDSSSFLEIAERWQNRNQIPVSVELFSFLKELELRPIVAANKIDNLSSSELDDTLDGICAELGISPPWRQWLDIVVPLSAKKGEGIDSLKGLMRERLKESGAENYLRYI